MARTSGLRVPRFWKSLRLTPRLILYMVVVASVPVVLIGFIGFSSGSRGIEHHTESHLTSVVKVKAQEVERWFRPLEASGQVLANSSLVREQVQVLLDKPGSIQAGAAQESLLTYFDDLSRRNTGLRGIAVVSADKETILASTSLPTDAMLDTLLSLVRAPSTATIVHLSPYIPGEATPTAGITEPLVQDGQVLAYIVLLASPVPLYETLAPDAGLGPGGKVYLVNQNGEVLTPPQRLSRSSSPIRATGLITESANRFSSGLRYKDFLGTDVVGAYQPLESLGWGVAVEMPADEAFKDIDQMRWGIIGASGAFLILIVVISLLITGHITRPLKTLTAGARAVGSGNLSYRIEVDRDDEIGMLAQSFNQMAEDLQETQNRVVEAERTAALQAFTETKVDQLKQLSRFGLLITTEDSLGGLVERIPSMVREITRANVAALVVLEEEGDGIDLAGHTELTGYEWVSGLFEDYSLLNAVLREHGLIPRREDLEVTDFASRQCRELKELLATPLRSEGGVVMGWVIIANLTQESPFSQEDQELIQIIAGYASATLQKLRKESRLQRSEQGALEVVEELRRTQEQLVQSQKMEAIGRLAGGVAHDFNNLLTAIMGYSQLAVMASPHGEHPRTELQEIQKAGERAANLTNQLLAFSRRQIIEPRIIDLNNLVANTDMMLRRLIGEDIELVAVASPGLGAVKVDQGQMEQVLLNLAVNARDAMPQGGKITIETANVTLDEHYARQHTDATHGDYVMLSFSDTGSGMSEEVREHIFEPFFTTKEVGKGTGLGLATCYGIVKQNGGHIEVSSQPGQGATFKIYLPRTNEVIPSPPSHNGFSGPHRGTETVLLAEDEPLVRDLACRTLREQGYTVLDANDGVEALKLAQKHAKDEIHLLLTDVVMPKMGGKELAERISSVCPHIKVLFTSGYTDDFVPSYSVTAPGTNFIQKPFSPEELALKVREVLERA